MTRRRSGRQWPPAPSNLAAVVGPMQQRLALPPAAGGVARLAMPLDLADMPADGLPALDPALLPPDRQRPAGIDAGIAQRAVAPFAGELGARESGARKFPWAIGQILSAKKAEGQHLRGPQCGPQVGVQSVERGRRGRSRRAPRMRTAKKTGPLRARPKFASVGAPANHLPEGKKLRACSNQSGRITVPHVTQQKGTMQIDAAAHNAAADMPAMHYRRTSGQLVQWPASRPMQNDQHARIARRRPCVRCKTLEHVPEKWKPVFRKDHAQSKNLDRDPIQ